ESVSAITVVHHCSGIGIKGYYNSVNSSVGESSIPIIYKDVTLVHNDGQDLVINISLVLDVSHHISNNINGHCFAIVIGESVRSIPIVFHSRGIGIKGYCNAINRSMGKRSIAVIHEEDRMSDEYGKGLVINILCDLKD